MPIVSAFISPHPPIILPSIGSEKDRNQVKKTIAAMESLGGKLIEIKPQLIIISAPHPDWGIKVPLRFLNNAKLRLKIQNYQNPDNPIIKPGAICPILTAADSPKQHFEWGKQIYRLKIVNCKLKTALIASGDLSHCLKEDGPYGFNPDGPKFDKELIDSLEKKDIENILNLEDKYPEAGECGLRSFCFMLGILEETGVGWQSEILSYECPFGVGYLTANFLN